MCIQSAILTLTFVRPFQKDLDWCHFVWTRSQKVLAFNLDNLDGVDVHPICYFDLDIFLPFQTVTKNFFSTSDLGWVPLCGDQILEIFCHLH